MLRGVGQIRIVERCCTLIPYAVCVRPITTGVITVQESALYTRYDSCYGNVTHPLIIGTDYPAANTAAKSTKPSSATRDSS